MTDHDPQDPQARLAAADPAASAPDPDIAAIRARVLSNSGADPGAGPAAETGAADNVVPLRRRRWPIVAGAVAAGVCVLAGTAVAGAAVGRSTAPQSGTVTAAAPVPQDALPAIGTAPVSPNMPAVAGGAPAPGAPSAEVGAPQAAAGAPVTADAKSSVYPGGGWGSVFEPVPDLPDEAGTARGYRLDGSDVDPRALAAKLASAFGVKGKPKSMEGSWMVGPEDYSSATIWVSEDGMVSWSYSDPTQNPWECGAVGGGVATPEPAPAEPGVAEPRTDMGAATTTDDATSSGDAASTEPAPPESCEPKDAPMSERDALAKARELLGAVGVTDDEAAGIDIEWETGTDGYTTWVTAWQRVEGNRTQLSWSVTFGPKEPLWANGFAAGLVPVEDYPIVGAKTAVERSQQVRWMTFGPTLIDGGMVVPMAEDAATTSDTATAATPRVSSPGMVEVWMSPVTVTGAEPTLVQYWQPDGTMLLLPAYRLSTADDRGTWAVIAVADSAVTFVDAP